MKIQLIQLKYKCNDFQYNYENIISQNINNEADLIIFPEIENSDNFEFDSNYNSAKDDFYRKICNYFSDKNLLIGTNFIKNGSLENVNNCSIDILNNKIYISKNYDEDVECDLYILAENKYYTMNSYSDFVENIGNKHNFIHTNAIMLDEENVYTGQSFVKNKNGNINSVYPFLEEFSSIIDFSDTNNVVDYKKLNLMEEIFKVTTFAIKEYCENCGFKQVVLGLSGGIDSALVATLAAYAIGKENVYAIMLPSKYSSEGSIKDAEKLVSNLGINVETIPIKSLFEIFMTDVAKESKMDLAEENLQSRLRAIILMFNSNRFNRLLLSTGNKSEVACGYGTLYGDMCGGFNPIADLTKTKVYELSNWINRDKEVISKEIIEKEPSAELKPNQKDSDSLPKYELLDKIIVDYVENQLSYEDLLNKYNKSELDKTLKLIHRAQFKRNQACLGVRLTDNAFCSNIKYPIMQKIY
ncbi:NAD(+) synthase [bacterium]|nr:NAD(+) synthase [bacterium]